MCEGAVATHCCCKTWLACRRDVAIEIDAYSFLIWHALHEGNVMVGLLKLFFIMLGRGWHCMTCGLDPASGNLGNQHSVAARTVEEVSPSSYCLTLIHTLPAASIDYQRIGEEIYIPQQGAGLQAAAHGSKILSTPTLAGFT